jgi:hypothetical protein
VGRKNFCAHISHDARQILAFNDHFFFTLQSNFNPRHFFSFPERIRPSSWSDHEREDFKRTLNMDRRNPFGKASIESLAISLLDWGSGVNTPCGQEDCILAELGLN